jgi:uncharacterized protein with PQ loop repeat
MWTHIAFFPIFGKPLIMWLGILTLLCFLTTAGIAIANRRRTHKIPVSRHVWMARISISLALAHGILGILVYL